MTGRSRLAAVLLVTAVALAFADASVVALALPDLYAEFDTTIVGVSWVLTTYALVVAIVAVPITILHRHLPPRGLVLAGTAIFAVASIVAGASTTLPMLLVARGAQGVGATLLLAGSLPVLAAVISSEERARKWWVLAATVGAVVGPALGGVLTQLLDWRAIFYVQAPVVAAALLVGLDPAARAVRTEGHLHGEPGVGRRQQVFANVGFGLVFAALVAALFLGVLLAIEVWRYTPIQGALLVTALPLGILVARGVTATPARIAAIAGPLLLAAGLLGLGFLPGARPLLAAVALALCGAGFDLVSAVLEPAAVPANSPAVQAAGASIGARHAGLVLGLVVIAPVLASSLDAGIERATLGATREMLEVELPLDEKLPVTWDLRTAIEDAPKGQVPDLGAVFDERGAEPDNALGRAKDGLMDTVTEAVTRSFRPAFGVAAALAALAAIPALLVAASAPHAAASPGRRKAATITVGVLGVAAIALVSVEFAMGAADTGTYEAADPCTAGPDPYEGGGLDGVVQSIALSALNGAACELGTSRERLVLSIDPDSGYDDVTWDDATAEQALRVGAERAIDDAEERGTLPGFVASILRFAAERAPISWLVERLPIPGG